MADAPIAGSERLAALERLYEAVRFLAYDRDCDACGTPDTLLDLCDELEKVPAQNDGSGGTDA